MFEGPVELEQETLVEISKPLFYGFMLLSSVSLAAAPGLTGNLLGLAVLASITFVSAGLADGLEDDWARFLDLIAVTSLLLVVLFASYTAASFSVL